MLPPRGSRTTGTALPQSQMRIPSRDSQSPAAKAYWAEQDRLAQARRAQQPAPQGMSATVMPGQAVHSYAQPQQIHGQTARLAAMGMPAYGLGGAERAIGQGFDGAMGLYQNNYNNAINALQGGIASIGPGANSGYGRQLPWQPPGDGPNLESNAVGNYHFRQGVNPGDDEAAFIRGDAYGNTGIRDGQTGRTADGRWTIAQNGGTAGSGTRILASDTPHTMQQWVQQGREDVSDYGAQANRALGQARRDIGNGLTAFNTHMGRAGKKINQGADQALGRLDDASGGYDPYVNRGRKAFGQVSALSGAMGSDAQQNAYDQFVESPGQAWLREQAERAVLRNASATGNLGGGRVLQELQRQGMGLAAQDFDNYYNRLAGISDVGMRALDSQTGLQQTAAGLENNRGVALAGLNQDQGQANLNTAENLANIQGQISGNLMGTGAALGGLSDSGAGYLTSRKNANTAAAASVAGAQIGANASRSNAQLAARTDLTNNLANAYMNLGNNTANMAYNTGNNLANMRYDTGRNIADANLNTGNNIAGNIAGTGQAGANVVNAGANNLSNVLGGAGQTSAQGWYGLGSGITGVNNQLIGGLAGTNGITPPQNGQGVLGNVGNFLGGVGAIAGGPIGGWIGGLGGGSAAAQPYNAWG